MHVKVARLTRNPPVQGVVSCAATVVCRALRAGLVCSRGLGGTGRAFVFPPPEACFATWLAVLVKA